MQAAAWDMWKTAAHQQINVLGPASIPDDEATHQQGPSRFALPCLLKSCLGGNLLIWALLSANSASDILQAACVHTHQEDSSMLQDDLTQRLVDMVGHPSHVGRVSEEKLTHQCYKNTCRRNDRGHF